MERVGDVVVCEKRCLMAASHLLEIRVDAAALKREMFRANLALSTGNAHHAVSGAVIQVQTNYHTGWWVKRSEEGI